MHHMHAYASCITFGIKLFEFQCALSACESLRHAQLTGSLEKLRSTPINTKFTRTRKNFVQNEKREYGTFFLPRNETEMIGSPVNITCHKLVSVHPLVSRGFGFPEKDEEVGHPPNDNVRYGGVNITCTTSSVFCSGTCVPIMVIFGVSSHVANFLTSQIGGKFLDPVISHDF